MSRVFSEPLFESAPHGRHLGIEFPGLFFRNLAGRMDQRGREVASGLQIVVELLGDRLVIRKIAVLNFANHAPQPVVCNDHLRQRGHVVLEVEMALATDGLQRRIPPEVFRRRGARDSHCRRDT